jgi:hypothetical protein
VNVGIIERVEKETKRERSLEDFNRKIRIRYICTSAFYCNNSISYNLIINSPYYTD